MALVRNADQASSSSPVLTVAGLFAGIGGIELGLHACGHETRLLCEIDASAQAVLRSQFREVELVADVRAIDRLPAVDLVSAGFPCQDLSQAGMTSGIAGSQSGLVGEVFRLIANEKQSPRWLLLENVPFMLQLDGGRAMQFLVDSLEALGFTWAYRVVDARAFGLPQRRQRVLLLASRSEDPRRILFGDDAGEPEPADESNVGCGFYWTEGKRGLGWAIDAVPTLKGGSGLGIPSPPAIRMPDGFGMQLPHICDAERLQGFPTDWTLPGAIDRPRGVGARWKMVGNAVNVRVAWGRVGERHAVAVSMWPVQAPYTHLLEFLEHDTRPLSRRATAGFLSRAQSSSLHFPLGFIDDVESHLNTMEHAERRPFALTS